MTNWEFFGVGKILRLGKKSWYNERALKEFFEQALTCEVPTDLFQRIRQRTFLVIFKTAYQDIFIRCYRFVDNARKRKMFFMKSDSNRTISPFF